MLKNHLKTILLFLFFAISISSLTSCKKEGCTDENAENYNSDANINDESCTYESDKFVGVYSVTEICGEIEKTYELTINQPSSSKEDILIYNLNDLLGSLIGINSEVSGNSISFEKDYFGTLISGSGILTDNTLSIDYSVSEDGISIQCIATCVKQ